MSLNFKLISAAGLLFFFFAYSFLPLSAPLRFNSPDEMSNFHFSRLFAQTGRLWHFEPLNFLAGGLVHPRSTRVVEGLIVPGGWLGLPVIYGLMGRVFTESAILFITPLAAVLAAAAWGGLIGRLFGRIAGRFGAALLLLCPAWWYEAGRTMMPNTLFVSLIIISAYLFIAQPLTSFASRKAFKGIIPPELIDSMAAGAVFGLALSVRLSETLWLAAAITAVMLGLGKRAPWKRLCAALVFAALAMAPFFVLNRVVYGNFFESGYGAISQAGGQVLSQDSIAGLLFPFGFAPRAAVKHFFIYGVSFFWWWSVLTVSTVIFFAVRAKKKAYQKEQLRRRWIFTSAGAFAAVWLIFMYGSWNIQDTPDPKAITIGSSYIRYWLPIFVMSTVPIAWMFAEICNGKRLRLPACAGALAVIAAASGVQVFASAGDGLLDIRRSLISYDREAKIIMEMTPPDALIVADQADKFIFPDRSVVHPLRSEQTYDLLGRLAGRVPLYYAGVAFPEGDLKYLREKKLPPLGLSIEPVVSFENETLYRFDPARK